MSRSRGSSCSTTPHHVVRRFVWQTALLFSWRAQLCAGAPQEPTKRVVVPATPQATHAPTDRSPAYLPSHQLLDNTTNSSRKRARQPSTDHDRVPAPPPPLPRDAPASPPPPPKLPADKRRVFTLSSAQQTALAMLVQFTTDSVVGPLGESTAPEALELQCLTSLVQLADQAFTTTAEPYVLETAVWSTDLGISREEAERLLSKLSATLREVEIRSTCAQARWTLQDQHTALHRIATALARACLLGRSANFKVTESPADQLLRFLSPQSSNLGLAVVMLLALAGAGMLADWLVLSRLLSPLTTEHVPCQCRLCCQSIIKGGVIGSGGFGQVFACDVVQRARRKSRGTRPLSTQTKHVIKMIEVDLVNDVNVLQDALDEAKNLISLQHANIVKYEDVFVHRDLQAKRQLEAQRRQQSGWLHSLWQLRTPVSTSSSGDKRDRRGKTGDYVCIVMEYCEQGTLLDYVATGVPLPLDVVVAAFHQILSAVEYVHISGTVHFDLKLENIFVASAKPESSSEGRSSIIKVGDFGLAMRRNLVKAPSATGVPSPPALRTSTSQPELWSMQAERLAGRPPPPPPSLHGQHSLGLLSGLRGCGAAPLLHANAVGAGQVGRRVNVSSNSTTRSTAQATDSEPELHMSSGNVAGTAPYQPPQCFDGTDTDQLGPDVDLWALGCALFEACTCQSLPLEPPLLGQIALDQQEWAATFSELQRNFAESCQGMATCALADKQLGSSSRSQHGAFERPAIEAAQAGLQQLLADLLNPNPNERPALKEVLARPWFKPFKNHPLRFFASNNAVSRQGVGQVGHKHTSLHLRAKSMALFPRPKLVNLVPTTEAAVPAASEAIGPGGLAPGPPGAAASSSSSSSSDKSAGSGRNDAATPVTRSDRRHRRSLLQRGHSSPLVTDRAVKCTGGSVVALS